MKSSLPSVMGFMGDQFHGSNWWRTIMPFSYLQRRGLPVVWSENTDPSAAMEAGMGLYDVLIFFGLAFPDAQSIKRYVKNAHRQGSIVIFDTDDDLLGYIGYMKEAWHEDKRKQYEEDRPKIRHTIKGVDAVTASVHHLAARVAELTDKPVAVVPNLLDMEWWAAVQAQGKRLTPEDRVCIGWSGARRNERDLEHLAAAWSEVARLRPDVTHFVVAGYDSPALRAAVPETMFSHFAWSSVDVYPLGHLSIDIGCCPLAPTLFNLSKSPIKAMEYGATKIPVVASPAVYGSAFREVAFAGNVEQWTSALLDLVDSSALRKKRGQMLYDEVLVRHSLQCQWKKYPSAWEQLLEENRTRRNSRVLTLSDALDIV